MSSALLYWNRFILDPFLFITLCVYAFVCVCIRIERVLKWTINLVICSYSQFASVYGHFMWICGCIRVLLLTAIRMDLQLRHRSIDNFEDTMTAYTSVTRRLKSLPLLFEPLCWIGSLIQTTFVLPNHLILSCDLQLTKKDEIATAIETNLVHISSLL